MSWSIYYTQVDMKIMYYELIKMLIEYERSSHPEEYDATKTVGKIEGYQVRKKTKDLNWKEKIWNNL